MTKIKRIKKYIPLLIICALSTEFLQVFGNIQLIFTEQYQYYETVNEEELKSYLHILG